MNISPIIVFSDHLVPSKSDAMTVWPFIFVRPASRGDKGLIEHETVHWSEQASTPTWWLRYLLSPAFRQAAEVRAYRRQIAVGGISLAVAAHYLTTYGTGLAYSEALELLKQ